VSVTTALVGPLPQVSFADGTRAVYTPPRDTCDPRAGACTEHRTACDCREALFAEQRQETRAAYEEANRTEQAMQAVARLHRRTDNQYVGTRCDECSKPWPCPTWRIVAPADWLVSMWEKHGTGPAAADWGVW